MYIAVVDADPGNPDILRQQLVQAGHSVMTWTAYLDDVERQRTPATSRKILLINTLALTPHQQRTMWAVLHAEVATLNRPVIICVPSREYIARHLFELHEAGCLVLSAPLEFGSLLDLLKYLEETAQGGKVTTHPTAPQSSQRNARRQSRYLLGHLPLIRGVAYIIRSAQQWYRATRPQ